MAAFIQVKGRTADMYVTMMRPEPKLPGRPEHLALVHCPICTHRVEAVAVINGRNLYVRPGEKCARCKGSLDAGFVIRLQPQAA